MAQYNTFVSSLASNRREIRNKMEYILNTFLGEDISAYNTEHGLSGPYAVQYPKTVNLSVNSMDLRDGTDQFPCVSIIAGRSQTDVIDVLGTNGDIIDYNIICATVCDAADINFNIEQSQALALITANLMERNLVSSPGSTDVSSVYRVDQVASTDSRPTAIGSGLWLLSYSCTIRVFSRAQSQYDPTYLPKAYNIKPSVESNYSFTGTATWREDSLPLVVGQRNQMASLDVNSGALAYDLYFESNIPTGSDVTVIIQRDKKITELTNVTFNESGTAISIALDTAPEPGDVWTVSITVNPTNNFISFPARIASVT